MDFPGILSAAVPPQTSSSEPLPPHVSAGMAAQRQGSLHVSCVAVHLVFVVLCGVTHAKVGPFDAGTLLTLHLPPQAPAGASLIAARGLRAAADRNIDASGSHAPACQPMQAGGGQRHAPEHIQKDEVNLMLSYLGDHAFAGQGGGNHCHWAQSDAGARGVPHVSALLEGQRLPVYMCTCGTGSPRPSSAGPVSGVPMSGGLLGRRVPSSSLLGAPRPQPPPALPAPPLQRVSILRMLMWPAPCLNFCWAAGPGAGPSAAMLVGWQPCGVSIKLQLLLH